MPQPGPSIHVQAYYFLLACFHMHAQPIHPPAAHLAPDVTANPGTLPAFALQDAHRTLGSHRWAAVRGGAGAAAWRQAVHVRTLQVSL